MEYRHDIKEAVKTIPGRVWDGIGRRWTFPATELIAECLQEIFSWRGVPISGDDEFERASEKSKKKLVSKPKPQKALEITPRAKDGKLLPIPETKTKPFNHQTEAFWLMVKAFGDEVKP